MTVEQHFRQAKNFSSNRGVLGENVLKETPRKRSMLNKRDKDFQEEVGTIDFDDLKVAFLAKKKAGRSNLPQSER